jgi:hypothetical protein
VTSDTIPEILLRLRKSYLHGAHVPRPPINLDHYEAELQEQLYGNIKNHLGTVEIKLLRRCSVAYSKGLEAARTGQAEIACRYFGEARLVCASPDFSVEGRALGCTFLAAAEAYLDYRYSDFERSQERLYESLTNDELLETEYGHHILHVHRLHLINNLIRIQIRRGELPAAISRAAQLIGYMQGACNEAPAPGRWGKSFRDALPPQAIATMFVQLAAEMGQALVGKTPAQARALFEVLDGQLPEKNTPLWHPLALEWFYTKRAYVGTSIERYLGEAANYLREGPSVAPALWQYVALDVVFAVDSLPYAEAVGLRKEILKDTATWGVVSSKVRGLITDLAGAPENELEKCV